MDVGFAKTGIIAINVKRIADMLKSAFPKNTKENTMVIYERSKVMFDICGDNRFEIIETCKNKLIAATNITDCPDEMAVIDSVLYRCWQMGWLPEPPEEET